MGRVLQEGKLSAGVWVHSSCAKPHAPLGKEPTWAPLHLRLSVIFWLLCVTDCLGILLQVWAFDSISFPSEFFLTANLLINACSSIQTVNTMRSALSQTVLTLTPVDEPHIHLLNQVSSSCFLSFKWKCWGDNSIFGNRNWQWWKNFFLLELT